MCSIPGILGIPEKGVINWGALRKALLKTGGKAWRDRVSRIPSRVETAKTGVEMGELA